MDGPSARLLAVHGGLMGAERTGLGHATSFDAELWGALLESDHECEEDRGDATEHEALMLTHTHGHGWIGSFMLGDDGLPAHSAGSPATPLAAVDPVTHARCRAYGSASGGDTPCSDNTTGVDGDHDGEHGHGEHTVTMGDGTTLIGGKDVISQAEFLSAIQEAGGRDANQIFEFRWPEKRGKDNKGDRTSAQRQSAILTLTPRQHGILYALAGCSDVCFAMSKVSWPVRDAIKSLYHIDKLQFSTWFKNRRPPLKRRLAREGQVWVPARPRRSTGSHPAPSAASRAHLAALQQQEREQREAITELPHLELQRHLVAQHSTGSLVGDSLAPSSDQPPASTTSDPHPREFAGMLPPQHQQHPQQSAHQQWWQQHSSLPTSLDGVDMMRRPPRPSARLTERLAALHRHGTLHEPQELAAAPHSQDSEDGHLALERMGLDASPHCNEPGRPDVRSHPTSDPSSRHRILEPMAFTHGHEEGMWGGMAGGGGTAISLQRSRSCYTTSPADGAPVHVHSADRAGPSRQEVMHLAPALRRSSLLQTMALNAAAWRKNPQAAPVHAAHRLQRDSIEAGVEEAGRQMATAVTSQRLAARIAQLQQQQQQQQQEWGLAEQQAQEELEMGQRASSSGGGGGASSILRSLMLPRSDPLGVRRPSLKYRHSEPLGLGLSHMQGAFQASRLSHASRAGEGNMQAGRVPELGGSPGTMHIHMRPGVLPGSASGRLQLAGAAAAAGSWDSMVPDFELEATLHGTVQVAPTMQEQQDRMEWSAAQQLSAFEAHSGMHGGHGPLGDAFQQLHRQQRQAMMQQHLQQQQQQQQQLFIPRQQLHASEAPHLWSSHPGVATEGSWSDLDGGMTLPPHRHSSSGVPASRALPVGLPFAGPDTYRQHASQGARGPNAAMVRSRSTMLPAMPTVDEALGDTMRSFQGPGIGLGHASNRSWMKLEDAGSNAHSTPNSAAAGSGGLRLLSSSSSHSDQCTAAQSALAYLPSHQPPPSSSGLSSGLDGMDCW